MRHSPAVKAAAGIRKEKEAEIAVGGPQSHSIAEITLYIIFRRKKKEEEKKKRRNKTKKRKQRCWWPPNTLILWER